MPRRRGAAQIAIASQAARRSIGSLSFIPDVLDRHWQRPNRGVQTAAVNETNIAIGNTRSSRAVLRFSVGLTDCQRFQGLLKSQGSGSCTIHLRSTWLNLAGESSPLLATTLARRGRAARGSARGTASRGAP